MCNAARLTRQVYWLSKYGIENTEYKYICRYVGNLHKELGTAMYHATQWNHTGLRGFRFDGGMHVEELCLEKYVNVADFRRQLE